MAKAITTTKLVEEFGNYYIKEGQNVRRLRRAMTQMPVTLEKHATRIYTEETLYRMSNPKFQSLIQPFTTTFSSKGGVEFHPNSIPLPKIKIDLSMTPDDIEDSWIGFMAGDDARTRKEWPIVRWMYEEYIKNQANEDRELQMVYKGVRNDAGTTPSDCMDGLHKQLVDGSVAEYHNNVIAGIGELDADTIFDQIEAFDKAIDSRYLYSPLTIFVAPEIYRAYLTNYREKGYYNIQNEKDIVGVIDFTGGKHILAPLPSMAGTKHMFATVPGNLLWLTNRNLDSFKADIQAIHYDVDIMINWREGCGFGCNEMVWTTSETVGSGTSTDTASPADGIVVRNMNIISGTPTSVEATSMTLNAEVNGELPDNATVKFIYGTAANSLSSNVSATESSTEDGVFTGSLTSLSAETKYYWALEVTVGTDKYTGAVNSVTTPEA